ncbi:MAG: CHAT domain-containing protein [Planctomycetaceae bacterium]
MKVFLSHCSADKPRIEEFAKRLRTEHAIDVWFDNWEIGAGEDVVAKINEALDACEAGLIAFSKNTFSGKWVSAEISTLIHDRIEKNRRIIPVILDDAPSIPALLRPLARRGIDEIEAIAAALKGQRPPRPPLGSGQSETIHRVVISLREPAPGQLLVSAQIGEAHMAGTTLPGLPNSILSALQQFREGPTQHLLKQTAAAGPLADERWLVQLGRDLGTLCLPGDAATMLANLLRDRLLGTRCEVIFEADRPEWLSLPFEALRLTDGTLLATQPGVATWRRPSPTSSATPTQIVPLAHPLKVLVAVGAPDEDRSKAVVLDHERELQVILDAVEPVQRHENCDVRILEVGHPEEIASALRQDPYHVLHLSCHGNQGQLLLETELGAEESVSPRQLVAALRGGGKQFPLVFLNACHSGVTSAESAGFALELLRAGVTAVVATLAPITDRYATQLAGAFYKHLAKHEAARPAEALAAARRDVEAQRQTLLAAGQSQDAGPAEYATATLYLAGDDRPLVDGHVDRVGLKIRSINTLAGELPALQRGDLIGRRHELRTALGFLRDSEGLPGVLLRGIGGLGKSALAGRIAMAQLEQQWYLAVHRGEFDLGSVVSAVAEALTKSPSAQLAQQLLNPQLEDLTRLKLLRRLMQTEPVLLVLDDFEQNLTTGGTALKRPEVQTVLEYLFDVSLRGRVLVTCRYGLQGVPGCEVVGELLSDVPLSPLSPPELRKLVQRLPGLRGQEPELLVRVVRGLGGHPRMLEFLNALLVRSEGGADPARKKSNRLTNVWGRMVNLARHSGISLEQPNATLDEQVELALRLGQRDIMLDELVSLAQEAGDAEVLFQAAVSNLPLSVAEVAGMLRVESQAVAPRWKRLETLSLLTVVRGDTALVSRWTAQGLQTLQPPDDYRARCVRAADFRRVQIQNRAASADHVYEVYRNYFAGGAMDQGAAFATMLATALDENRQTVAMVAVANDALESLPIEHEGFGLLADLEAKAHVRLGDTQRAKARWQGVLQQFEARATAHPDRADYQRDLSVSFNTMGDLYRALGEGPAARDACQKSLDIAQKLASAEPDRADYQRDLSVSFNKMGNLELSQGNVAAARDAFQKDLEIAITLANREPDRADYQVDVVLSLIQMAKFDEDPRPSLGRALQILTQLDRTGRLSPAHRPMLDRLRQAMQ